MCLTARLTAKLTDPRPQLQMEKLASRHAIQELMSWISLMENIIGEDQERISSAVGSERVQDFLQKYKVPTEPRPLLSQPLL